MEVTEEQLAEMIAKAVEEKASAIRSEIETQIEVQQEQEHMRMINAAAWERERVAVDPGTGYQYATIELAKVQYNPMSKRTKEELQPDKVQDLAEDIKAKGGLIRPLLVYRKDDGYVLVKGARRLAALRSMGEESVHAYILPMKPPFAQEESWVNGY